MNRLPTRFIGHGSPLTAFDDNQFTRSWAAMGATTPKPSAILCISAHWYTNGTGITASAQPRTVHDFYGFPDELYQYHYRAPGDPALAEHIAKMLRPVEVVMDQQWGFDHGSFTVLKHMYPQADIPVLQLSMDGHQDTAWHFDMGKRLKPLREQGVLILGSGNIVHNMRRTDRDSPQSPGAQFNREVRECLERRDFDALIHYQRFGESARFSVPTPDHYLPLLYVLGASDERDAIEMNLDELPVPGSGMLSVSFSGS